MRTYPYTVFYRDSMSEEPVHVFRTLWHPEMVSFITMLGKPDNPFFITDSRGNWPLGED